MQYVFSHSGYFYSLTSGRKSESEERCQRTGFTAWCSSFALGETPSRRNENKWYHRTFCAYNNNSVVSSLCSLSSRRAYHRSGRWSSVGQTLRGKRVRSKGPEAPDFWCLCGHPPSLSLSSSSSRCLSPSPLSSSLCLSFYRGPELDPTFPVSRE